MTRHACPIGRANGSADTIRDVGDARSFYTLLPTHEHFGNMSTESEAEQRAENENMPPAPKNDQVVDNYSTPSNSIEEQVAERRKLPPISEEGREKMIKQRQANRVDRLLNRRIPKFRTDVQGYLETCQFKRDQMVVPTNLSFTSAKVWKDYTTRWVTIHGLCEKTSAVLLFIEQFDTEFRAEWKVKKKDSVGKRFLYIKEKRKEFGKIRREHTDVVMDHFADLGITIPQVVYKDTTDEEADLRDLKEDGEEVNVRFADEKDAERNDVNVKL